MRYYSFMKMDKEIQNKRYAPLSNLFGLVCVRRKILLEFCHRVDLVLRLW